MEISHVPLGAPGLSFRQRWSNYLVIALSLIIMFVGLNLRDQVLNATNVYNNPEAGIRALYPRDWLLDTDGDYIFRVQDISGVGFKTTIQVSVQAVSGNASVRNVADTLTLNRSQILVGYDVLDIDEQFILPDNTPTTALSYTYVATDPNPFLESIPVVIKGLDVFAIGRGQVTIISFLAEVDTYSREFPKFETFLLNLEF